MALKQKAKLNRIWALALSLALALAILSGCQSTQGNSQATTAPSGDAAATESANPSGQTKELYTIKMMTGATKLKSSEEFETGKYIKDKFGIVFEYVPYTGDIREKQNLMLAAGDYGEIQYMQREDMVINYIKAGALLELDQYLSKMPNFQTRFKDVIPYWRLPGDGKLYKWETWIPRELDSDIEVNDVMVRTDALEKQNWPNPVSADNWIAFLKQAIKDLPQTAGQPTIGMTAPFAEPWGAGGHRPRPV